MKVRVRVLAFARVRELLGAGSQVLQVEDGASVGDVWDTLADRYTAIAALASSTRIARNGRIVTDSSERIEDGDELALLPPAGGG
jgi:molybdopterin synthase catalytic subunit/molybdopterin synthase sulfur carrier subunit